MRLLTCLLSVLFSMCSSAGEPGASAKEFYQQGISSYQDQRFSDAQEHFSAALKQEPNNKFILYNLGLTAAKLEQMGWAAATWRKATAIDPGFKSAWKALENISNSLPGTSQQDLSFWEEYRVKFLNKTSIHTALALCLFFLTLGAALLLRYFGLRRQALLYEKSLPKVPVVGVTLLCLWILSLALVGSKGYDYFQPRATVVAEQSQLRSGPGADHSPLIDITQGMEVIIQRANNDWIQVRLPGGITGWLAKGEIFHTSGKEPW